MGCQGARQALYASPDGFWSSLIARITSLKMFIGTSRSASAFCGSIVIPSSSSRSQATTRFEIVVANWDILAARSESGNWARIERDLLAMKADLPLHYVRREDYIRGQSLIEAKLDALGNKLDVMQLRAAAAGGPKNANH